MRIEKSLTRPGALSDPTHPAQEETAFGWGQNPGILADCHDVVILPCTMTTWLHADFAPSQPQPRSRKPVKVSS